MGATGWSFRVPYHEDMEQALEELKQKEFAAGRYEKPGVEWDVLDDFGLLDAGSDEEREEIIEEYGLEALRRPLAEVGVEGFRPWLKALDDAPAVRTRADLDVLQQFSSSGTGSILDISHVAPTPEFGTLSPLPRETLLQHFGTDKPTRAQVEAGLRALDIRTHLHQRGAGSYIVLYEAGQPSEIYIEGSTGD